jgi:hypothetical protein
LPCHPARPHSVVHFDARIPSEPEPEPPRPKLIDRYEEHLEWRWREGCHNAAQLWREVRDQGFTGKPGTVRLWATRRRHDHGQDPAAPEMALRLIL